MLDLEEFYNQYVKTIPPINRYITILEIEDVIVVNFDCLYDRECNIRGVDQLLYQLHRKGQGKRFLFISEDGANIHYSGAIQVVENIRNCFNLTTETCAVICREDIKIDNVKIVNNPSVPYWCRVLDPYIKDIDIPTGPFSKKFAVWFHRGTYYRLDLAKHLYLNHRDSSYISYQERGLLADRKLVEYFTDANWAWENTPIVHDQIFPNRQFNYDMIVGSSRKPYSDYAVEVVAETDVISTDWITEKTVKNLYIGKPFLLMSGVNSLAKIRQLGFKTFSPWINESYDTIPNIYLRLEAIKQEIDRLSTVDLNQLHKEIMPILQHNRKTYEKYIDSGR